MTEPNIRDTCYVCFRPLGYCYCDRVRRVDNQTEIIIIQHPRERFHHIGTARIAELCLGRVKVEIDHGRRFSAGGQALQLPPSTGLLYPGPNATPLGELRKEARPEHLVVLDGTWHHAKTLYRDIPALHALPQYAFTPSAPSRYRLRKEPREDYVSTIEAIVQCLRELEPETPGLDQLLDVFDSIIDQQLAARDGHAEGPRPKRPRQAGFRRIPRALGENYGSLIVAYGEGARGQRADETELVHWVAERVATGQRLELVLRPSAPLRDVQLTHMRLRAEDFEGAVDAAAFQQRWKAFLRPGETLATWNTGSLKMLRRTGAVADSSLCLKAAYSNLKRGRGSLEQVLAHEKLPISAALWGGRARERLASALTIADFLHRFSG